MRIVNQLLQFYLLLSMRNQQSIFVIILKASTSIVHSAVRALTEKFRGQTNRFLLVALYLLLLILIVDSYFELLVRLCLTAQKCAHLMGEVLLVVGGSEVGMSTNIVPITLQLAVIDFSLLEILSFLKMQVNFNQYRRTKGTFKNRNYYHKLTFLTSIGEQWGL